MTPTKKTTTLVIHAPDAKAREGSKSFEDILKDGVGSGYAISKKDMGRLAPGCTVVLLRKDRDRKRAEGRLVRLYPTK